MKQKNITRLLFVIFLVSGISGLIYETVWLRVLSRILGSTVQASSITVSAFMLGLTCGSFYIGKISRKISNRIRLYALLEAGIAITALAVFLLFEKLVPLYHLFFELSAGNMFVYRALQATVLFVLIVIPTFLMGGTLPVLSSIMQDLGNDFLKSLSFLYGINTFGAMLGVMLSGFVMLGSMGEFNTVLTAIVINALAGILVFFLAQKNADPALHPLESKSTAEELFKIYPEPVRRKALIVYAIVGFVSFALEILWMRMFQLPLGTAIYSFCTVLTIYLLGSALGSYSFGKFFRNHNSPLKLLSTFLFASAIFCLLGLFIYSTYEPWMSEHTILASPRKLLTTMLIVFPVTFITGLMFPLVTRLYVKDISETGNGIGKLYSYNTLGCIFGSLCCGYLFIPVLGTRNTMIMLALIGILTGWWISRSAQRNTSLVSKLKMAVVAVAFIAIAFFLPDPYLSVIKKVMQWIPKDELVIRMHKETAACTITSYGSVNDRSEKYLLINGIGMTSLVSETKLMAHLPLLLHYEDPKDMLIICYGMGTCLRSAVTHKNLHTDVAELVGEEYEINDFYHANGKEVLANPRVNHYTDDGRNFLLMHDKKYDVITIDPAPPVWSAGTVNLYTSEFFTLCKNRLNQDGITCLWIPPAPSPDVKMIMKSFITAYPNTEVYRGPGFPGFYMIGYSGSSDINMKRFEEAAADSAIMKDLNEWDPIAAAPIDLLKLKIFSASQVASYLEGVRQVCDNNPYTEFPLWRQLTDPEYAVVLNSNEVQKQDQ